jgi:dolichyl-phosphate beta-glucosyltransferase
MKTLSLVIPVYNEEARLVKTFTALERIRLPRGIRLSTIIFVDDGSRDATATEIRAWQKYHTALTSVQTKLIQYDKNRGKGNAVRIGMLSSKTDYTLFCDADISTPFTMLSKFTPFMENGIPVLIGTRKNGRAVIKKHQSWYRELLGRGYTFLSQALLGAWIVSDFTCGFKMFSKEAKEIIFHRVTSNGWGFDSEVLFLALKHRFKITEVPVVWSADNRSKVHVIIAIPQTLFDLVRIRIVHDIMPITGIIPSAYKITYTSLVNGFKSIL